MRLLWESKFDSFHEWTLIISKIVGRKAFLANLEHQYHVSQGGECDISAHSYRKGNYNAYSSLSHFTDKHYLQGKWLKEKLFLQIQRINAVYPNVENMIVGLVIKRMEIITSIEVYAISQVNINCKENGGKKYFSCKSKASISCILMWGTWL